MGEITFDYDSPRWTTEFVDCSLPLTFDTYALCSFNCLYCFSFYQKSHSMKGYLERKVKAVNINKVINTFENILKNNITNHFEEQAYYFIKKGYAMQWGGLADPFDDYEKKYGLTLELLKYFDKIDYPLSFSTKGVFFTEDSRYMDIIKKHSHNWHFKISIITNDEEKAKRIELRVPSVSDRFKAMNNLSKYVNTTLRFRPYIIGVSDDFKEVFKRAKENGAESVSTEFFCLEVRADTTLKNRYNLMSKVVGYDIYDFYRKNSEQAGYKRLNRFIKIPIIKEMREEAHKLGLRFLVSDLYGREYSDDINCCGFLGKSFTCNYMKAIQIGKEKGVVKFDDVYDEDAKKVMSGLIFEKANGFNNQGSLARAKFRGKSLYDYYKTRWNKLTDSNSMYAYKVFKPIGVENGCYVFKYVGEKVKKWEREEKKP